MLFPSPSAPPFPFLAAPPALRDVRAAGGMGGVSGPRSVTGVVGWGGMSWGALARPAYPVFMARKPPSPSLSPRSHTCCQTHCQAFGTAFAPAPFFAGCALRKYQCEFSFRFSDLLGIRIDILNFYVKGNLADVANPGSNNITFPVI